MFRFSSGICLFFCFSSAFPSHAEVADPGFGQPRDRQFEIANGQINIRFYPWQEIDDADLGRWLTQFEMVTPAGEKALQHEYEINESSFDDSLFLARDLRRKRGQKRFSLLYGCQHDDEEGFSRLIDIYGPLEVLLQEQAELWPLIEEQVKSACEYDPSDARSDAIHAAIATAPDEGVQLDELETVLSEMVEGFSGSFYALEVVTYALFRDGSVRRNPPRPLADFNAEASRELQPDSWSVWRKVGDDYQIRQITNEGQEPWRTIDVGWRPVPQPRDTRLSGQYEYSETTGNIWFGSHINWGDYTFRDNGTYTSSTTSMYGSGSPSGDMASINTFSHCNETGGSSTVSARGPLTDATGAYDSTGTPSVVAGGTTERDDCGDGKAGVYVIDGYTIEFQANNGVTERRPFYVLDDTWVVVGSQYYAK